MVKLLVLIRDFSRAEMGLAPCSVVLGTETRLRPLSGTTTAGSPICCLTPVSSMMYVADDDSCSDPFQLVVPGRGARVVLLTVRSRIVASVIRDGHRGSAQIPRCPPAV